MDANHEVFLQVLDQIKADIEAGFFREKAPLPSDFELAKQYGVSRSTLKEVIRVLEEENILTTRHGLGTFVNPKPILSTGIEKLGSVTEMILQSGKTPGSQYLLTELFPPTNEDKARFAPKQIDTIAQIERVRTADGQPVVYCIDKVDENLIPVDQVHNHGSIYRLVESYSNKTITHAITQIEPISYHEKISPMLHCEPNQALLLLKQMHYTENDEPVLYSTNYFRPDVFSFSILRRRD
ncbi:GntR family transcriptional regulator [Aquibacillus salsiterrae]|uniref:GntR family transcriptional regulator n=1 Tax=Aquibacillus salsiterrae TaxID=2950439 RepID=A0A9X3WB99_9BACI|nr:GntR family transcriptional regulator [Aquibacillus salsiterrae]MDC3416342.1 GntR family transcriptional regulator [Aquibacillus salsiterrae]